MLQRLLYLLLFLPLSLSAKEYDPPQMFLSKETIELALDLKNTLTTKTAQPTFPKVNLATGEYVEEEVDLVVAGSEPISFRRFYHHFAPPDSRYGNWIINPETYLVGNFAWNKTTYFGSVGEREGSITYMDSESFPITLEAAQKLQIPHFARGYKIRGNASYTNTYRGSLEAAKNPINSSLYYWKSNRDERFAWCGVIVDGSGRERHFSSSKFRWHKRRKITLHPKNWVGEVTPHQWIPYQIPIRKEVLPNGNIIHYQYTRWRDEKKWPRPALLSAIQVYNTDETKLLSALTINYDRYQWKLEGPVMRIKNRTIEYKEKLDEVGSFTVTGSDGRQATFVNTKRTRDYHPVVLACVDKPSEKITYGYNGNRLERVDKGEGRTFITEYDSTNRIKAQYAPVGPGGALAAIGRFEYHNNATVVYDAIGNKTTTHFDDKKRITAIVGSASIASKKWDERGWLIEESIADLQGNLCRKTSYQYDERGNVIVESTGDGKESHTITRSYSDCGFNLLLSEKEPSGKETRYQYKEGTNLVTKELIYEGDRLAMRALFTYDDTAVCVKKVVESEGYHRITYTKPKQELPCCGLPEEITEKTIDHSGNEILLQRVTYRYHPSGQILEENHYDADNVWRYRIVNQYDNKERVIATTDALGNRIEYSYDKQGNLLSKKGPRPDMYQEWSYDLANRPIEERIRQSEGPILVTKMEYDAASRLIAKIDSCGNITRYTYDGVGRVIAIEHPDGAVERKEYDALGNVTKEVDANGYETVREYNYQGLPTKICYPEGCTEHYTYNSDGTIASRIDRNGAKSSYSYDLFGHPILCRTTSSAGVQETSASNSPFAPLSETDANGVTTYYDYDFAGRKIAERKGERLITYDYDTLGQIARKVEGDCVTLYSYDLLGRLIEERREGHFQESYAYDEAGNQTEVTTCAGTTKTLYNSLSLPILKIDPLGNPTKIEYHLTDCRKKFTTNAKGVTTIEHYDCRKRLIEKVVQNKEGAILQKREFAYDAVGNQIQALEHLYKGSAYSTTITNEWTYGPGNLLTKLVESGKKETHYEYDEKGRLKTTHKADGTKLIQEYDELGRLSRHYGPDFDYRYTYDNKGNLLTVADKISNTSTFREYDIYDNVSKEVLSSGITISREFDPYGKLLTLSLPNGEKIHYSYKGGYLYSVEYKGEKQIYAKRNLAGLPTEMSLAGEGGIAHMQWDAALRLTSFVSPHYSAYYTYDALGNITEKSVIDSLGTEQVSYAYDEINQLLSENNYSYQYDSLYNRLSKNEHDYQVNNLHQITDDGEREYSYDASGRVTSDGLCRFTYDSLDRLTSVTCGEKTTTYSYDPFHRRVTKDEATFLWDDKKEIGKFAFGKLIELRILGEGLGAEIGGATLLELHDKRYIPLHDLQGSLVTLLALSGEPIESYRYTAFGEELTPNKFSPWRFSSKRVDEETGFVYYGRRYYAPPLGRWSTPDPMGFADGPNLYAYVHNRPLTHVDLHGLWRQAVSDAFHFAWGMGEMALYNAMQMGRSFGGMCTMGNEWHPQFFGNQQNFTWENPRERSHYLGQKFLPYTYDAKNLPNTTSRPIQMRANGRAYVEDALAIACGYNLVQNGLKWLGYGLKGAERGALAVSSREYAYSGLMASQQTPGKTGRAKPLPNGHIWDKSSPFKNKTSLELHDAFLRKGYEPIGKNCIQGQGNYINPKNGRQYHIDPKDLGRYREPSHIDVSRPKGYSGSLGKRRYRYRDD